MADAAPFDLTAHRADQRFQVIAHMPVQLLREQGAVWLNYAAKHLLADDYDAADDAMGAAHEMLAELMTRAAR